MDSGRQKIEITKVLGLKMRSDDKNHEQNKVVKSNSQLWVKANEL